MKHSLDHTPDELYKEYQANVFAAALLMPKELTLKIWRETESFDYLADFFDVPMEAVFFRLESLGLLE